MSEPAKLTAAIAVWMAVWWVTEAVNTAVTALLPLVLFPITGVLPLKNTAAEYANELIYLFLGGFIFGKAIERWNLHRRIALTMIGRLGASPGHMLLGFMAATAFISMWISNTATAVMMTPVAVSVAASKSPPGDGQQPATNFAKVLLLGVGYACSIGGLGTLVGTPTNGIFVNFVQDMGQNISFVKWFVVGFPFMLLLLLVCWRLLLWLFPLDKNDFPLENHEKIHEELRGLGRITRPETLLLFVFGLVVSGWVSGSLLWYARAGWTSTVGDTIVVMSGAIALFVLPSGRKRTAPALMDWKTAERIPWGVIVLFGGGLALAKGFDYSGLAAWLGGHLEALRPLPKVVILLAVLSLVVLLSEIASNIATASMMMPVLAALAVGIDTQPLSLLMIAAMGASIGFGLPIATAPNSIVYASGYLTTRDMARAGFLLDTAAILLLLVVAYVILPLAWGIRI